MSIPNQVLVRSQVRTAAGRAGIVIYVGGGNPRMMLDEWREKGVDVELSNAWREGKVLCGVSAGALCWFDSGFSDAEKSETTGDSWEYTEVDALSLVAGIYCPHLNDRTLPLIRFLHGRNTIAYGVADDAALIANEGEVSAVALLNSAGAFEFRSVDGCVTITEIPTRRLET